MWRMLDLLGFTTAGIAFAMLRALGGRFLLAWTEGPASGHQVRALAFGADGSPSGSPILISAPADNAGQPAIAINANRILFSRAL